MKPGPQKVGLFGYLVPIDGGVSSSTPLPIVVSDSGVLLTALSNQQGSPIATFVVNSDGVADTTEVIPTGAFIFGYNPVSTNFDRVQVQPNNSDAIATETTGNLASESFLYGYNGSTFDRVRVANIFHTVVATAAGNTAVWTPTAGKKFRLMGYTISAAGTLAATGVNTLQLRDGGTVIKTHLANMIQTPTVSISGGDTQIGADLGQGQLSATANNVLNVNLSTAMATGGVAVNVWGTEE